MSKIYKFFSFLLVACLATVGAWAQTPVKSLADLENGAAYSIKSEGRGYLIFDAGKDASRAWCSDNTTNGATVTFDQTNLNHLWTFYTSASGGRYLFNLGAQKFLYKDSEGVGTTFSLEPLGNDVTFKASTSPSKSNYYGDIENYPVVIAFGDNEINLSVDQNPSVFTNWNDTGDTGNIMQIVKVADVSAELMADIRTAVNAYEGVTEPYPVNFDKDMNRTRTDRTLNSITLTEEGQEGQTVTLANASKIYNDQHETSTLTCTAGSTLTATFNYNGYWVNGYVYIDTDNDYAFSFNEGNTDQSGTDLKAFAFYSGDFNNDLSGYNSAGESITGDARSTINPPSFTAPTTPGTYRIRFKVDWNSVDPGGQKAADGTVTSKNGIAANGGYIVDATLEVTGSTTPEGPIAPVSITPEDQSEVESFTSATITFEENVTYDELMEVTIAQRNGLYYQKANVSVDGATVTVSAPEEITEAGTYAISVPAGAFSTADGRTNEAFTTMFAITEPAGPADTFVYTSVVPADGSEVAELSSITVTYPAYVADWIDETQFNVVDAENNVVTTASLTFNESWYDVVIELADPITAEGTYTITVPAGYIYSNDGYDPFAADKGVSNGAIYNPEFTLTYTVKAASEPINTFVYTSVDPANESVVKELGDITITFPASVTNYVNVTPINVINSEDGSTVTTATLGYPLGEGYDKVVLKLAEAVKTNGTYTITVPEGYIYDYENAICNPAFTLTYTVDIVNGIGTVTIDSLEGKTIFTIDGRKVSGKLQRGAYIIDGQKKFVK